tara:strand:- start:496 stop:624 length:129 start_codon:yes stop_codon:yes gene_type:complete
MRSSSLLLCEFATVSVTVMATAFAAAGTGDSAEGEQVFAMDR